MPMTRRDKILRWTAYLIALWVVAVVNYYVLAPLPMALPQLLPIQIGRASCRERV